MDGELAALTSTAATTMVTLLTTDVWERAKSAVVALWQRVRPERAEAVGGELEEARTQLLDSGGQPEIAQALVEEWQGRLRLLLLSHPHLADELRRLVDAGFRPHADSPPGVTVHMSARASGGGTVCQARRDQHITGTGTGTS